MRFLQSLDELPESTVVVGGVLLSIVLGALHHLAGAELSFELFYLIPIGLVAWRAGRRMGLILAALCALAWLAADLAGPRSVAAAAWNAITHFGSFSVVAIMVSALRSAVDVERTAARTDFLTGLPNLRAFRDAAELEIRRLRRFRQPLTVAYLDLDNFKTVNDRFGHAEGDELLRRVAGVLRDTLRGTDVIARVGGDEFALILPATGAEPAWVVLRKVHNAVRLAMEEGRWPVTASVGALTCEDSPASVEELLRVADDLMYGAKRTGKNRVSLEIFDPASAAARAG
jgi:diguanylate cyclase (GGDEF)-like protein